MKLDHNVKIFYFEEFFIDAATFNFECANNASDSELTTVGINTGYVGIYVIQHLVFYKTMLRWSITANITDFKKYSRMYAIRMSLSQLGIRAFVCLEELEFYKLRSHKFEAKHLAKTLSN